MASIAGAYLLGSAIEKVNDYDINLDDRSKVGQNYGNNDYSFADALRTVGEIIFGDKGMNLGSVSALDAVDTSTGVFTCIESKDNKICQTYPASECIGACETGCIPTSPDYISECTLGTCIDEFEGTCSPMSPK